MAERLLTTTYRFEIFNPNSKMLKKAMQSQNTRIQMDELIASRTSEEATFAKDFNRSVWLSNLDEKSEKRREKNEKSLIQGELECVNKEIVLVRRAKLKAMLEEEKKQQEKELNEMGKAFYIKRV
ncbi:uncharacterized protein C1orf189 homolog [Exaiptasia diaphana]|uniref:Uncharacterized protein n=1 Tax=Exaiptasia diaphana TaxID=2652724 RepID=A0A913YBL0_EXADI|nr:uncharacterized protein C1orf189 homolog [Exaiptasia diaphana]KXJ28224.1 Uncharacterized protein C1orf189 [Exaiptasia diaphana]